MGQEIVEHQDAIVPVDGHVQKAGDLAGGEVSFLNELLGNMGSLVLRSGGFGRPVGDGGKVGLLFERVHALNENASIF